MKKPRLMHLGACLAIAVFGCQEKKEAVAPPVEKTVEVEAAAKTPPAEKPKEIKKGPVAFADCAAPIELSPNKDVAVGEIQAISTGYKLSLSRTDSDGSFRVGVLGPLNEDSGANFLALKKYLDFFKKEQADAIVVTGDVGETSEAIARLLKEVAQTKLPVMVLIGNRECRQRFSEGVAEAQKEFTNIINMNAFRLVEFPELSFVSLPGYHDATYLSDKCVAPETACQYFESTVEDVIRISKESKVPVVLVSHGPPHGESPQALDFALTSANVGDVNINRAIKEAAISFGFFSNIKEAGARASIDPEGKQLLSVSAESKTLYLNPGPADSTGWTLNDGTTSNGIAAVFKFEKGKGSYTLLRIPPMSKKERLEAVKFDKSLQKGNLKKLGTSITR